MNNPLRLRSALCACVFGLGLALCASAAAAPPRETLCLVTHYDGGTADYAEFAVANHTDYAARHGYGYRAFSGRLSGARFVDPTRGDLNELFGGGLFWQKTVAVQRLLEEGAQTPEGEFVTCAWVMWLDSDALVTAPDTPVEHVLGPFIEQRRDPLVPIDIVVAQETDHPINAGVFFVRRSEGGLAFLAAWQQLYPLYKTSWLPEQTALGSLAYVMEPWPSNHASRGLTPTLHPAFAIAPQRAFDSFYGVTRWFPVETQWQLGDFIAHFAGTPHHLRLASMRQVMSIVAR